MKKSLWVPVLAAVVVAAVGAGVGFAVGGSSSKETVTVTETTTAKSNVESEPAAESKVTDSEPNADLAESSPAEEKEGDYPRSAVIAFIKACNVSSGSKSTWCRCLLNALENRLTFAEFTRFEQSLIRNGLPAALKEFPEAKAAYADCE